MDLIRTRSAGEVKPESKPKKSPATPAAAKAMSVAAKDSGAAAALAAEEAAPKLVDTKGQLWTDRYAPQSTKKILGQQGDRSSMNKLKNWLENWYRNRQRKDKPPMKCRL